MMYVDVPFVSWSLLGFVQAPASRRRNQGKDNLKDVRAPNFTEQHVWEAKQPEPLEVNGKPKCVGKEKDWEKFAAIWY